MLTAGGSPIYQHLMSKHKLESSDILAPSEGEAPLSEGGPPPLLCDASGILLNGPGALTRGCPAGG